MSLHLGNLSSRVHRDGLERVFRRFGRCNVQLKDGFGFVVYDLPANAEKALRALRGSNICGEQITLSWSKRQPRPLQRIARGARSYGMQRGRNYERGDDYVNQKLGSNGQRDYRTGFKQPDSDGGRLNSDDMVDEVTSYREENIKEYNGEKQRDFREALPDEGDSAEPNLLENDRWGERVDDPSNEIGVETGLEFDRYEPYHDDDKRDGNANNQVTYSADSPTMRKSQDKIGRDQIGDVALNHPDNPKSQQKCYICGELGHKMRKCPRENASRRRLSRFYHQRDVEIKFRDKGEGFVKRFQSNSRRRLQLSRNSALIRRHKNDSKVSGPRKHRRSIRNGKSPVIKETQRSQRKDYGEKKRSRRENGTPERYRAKKVRGPVSSPIHSDYTASRSRSCSQSSKSISGSSSDSKSRSVSPRTRSPSSSSRSCSSHHSRSKSSKSFSRTKTRSSSPTSLSLPVSISRPVPSSPNKAQINQKGSSASAISPESKEVLDERGKMVEGYEGSDNSKLENMMAAVGNENAVARSKVEADMDKEHPQQRDEDTNRATSRVPCEVNNSCTPMLVEGDFTTGSLSPSSLREMRDLQTSDALVTEHMLAPTKKPDSETLVRSHTGNSKSISPEELYMVLKHYGLDHPEENEKDLPVETYFGSARLWPWEIIHYRRRRKGPISTENYARRIAQNKEFGIVDKYIRSSSGWGELGQDNS
ncbi:hypothetical protein F0562_015958 [Nyssa sinensis]|uniref:CCHC-type domain-containing protein n=1 Tax=Nyssa sinensis TaxID=561372 RepID=A0A5J4ZKY8_9ASTE|nr:hypothetical protein F0562_015958 [Nyssa sinensis]